MTKIEWVARPGTTPETWNVVGGCTKKSPGCANCYAIRQSWMKMHHPNPKVRELYEGTVHKVNGRLEWTGRINLASSERLEKPLRWRKPRTVFVCSMGDLFHKDVPDEFIRHVWNIMETACKHTFLVLTKRPRRMREFLTSAAGRFAVRGHMAELPNVWLGVTAENQATADEHISLLLQTPAAVRFVSCEPLLGAMNLTKYLDERTWPDYTWGIEPEFNTRPGLDWVITGGESGPGARPMHPDWARGLRDQCQAAGVPFFFKQHGRWLGIDQVDSILKPGQTWTDAGMPVPPEYTFDDGTICVSIGKKAAGRLLDGREWNEWPDTNSP